MKYISYLSFSLAWTFFASQSLANASIAKPLIHPMDSPRSNLSGWNFLEPINGTNNFRVHGKKAKDDKWIWDGREASRYIYCVREATSKCEELEYTKQCFGQNIPYPSTTLDLTNYFSQDQSLEKLITYQALKHLPKCWSAIQPFLCAVFFPKCEKINGVDIVYLPSLEMCKKTIDPCRILYNSSYFPEFLKCNETNFPSKCNNDAWDMKFNLTGQCLPPLVPVEHPANNFKGIEGCGLQCKDPLYTDDEHRTIQTTILCCAIFCFAIHWFVICTFLIDPHNGFKYSADTIFYVNLCCMISCIGWLLQFISDFHRDIVCRDDNTLRHGAPNEGENSFCILVFILVYYFSMAALCWFVIFAYACHVKFKSIGKVQERIDRKEENYFHVFAWTLPAVLTIATLVSSEVDGNSTAGICLVGSVNYHHQVWYVLVPIAISAVTAGYFVFRLMIILVNVRYSGKNIINGRDSNKIQASIMKIGIRSVLLDVTMIAVFTIQILKFMNFDHWNESLKASIICNIKSTYSDDDSASCKILDRPSKLALQIQILLVFTAKLLMASFVWSEATCKTWNRFFRKVLGKESEEPQMLPKHKVIARTYAKREEYKNKNRVSIEISNSHTDPVGMNFNRNSAGSQELDPSFANYLPRAVTRRPAITNFVSDSSRRSSVDSEISISVCQLSVESRRNSNDSQVSVKFAQMKTKIERRLRGAKPKNRASRRRDRRKDSSTSVESHQQTSTANVGRSAIKAINQRDINEALKFMLPSLSASDNSSQDSRSNQLSQIDMILQQFEMSEQKMTERKFTNDFNEEEYSTAQIQNDNDLSDVSGKENVCRSSRASKKSVGSRKSGRHNSSSRLKKTKRNSKSIAKSFADVLASSKKSNNGSNAFELAPMNGNLQGSYSGRSDVGIQTEIPETFLSSEFPTKLIQPDEDEAMEYHSLLPSNRVFLSTASKLRDNEISDSEKLKLLLLPSK